MTQKGLGSTQSHKEMSKELKSTLGARVGSCSLRPGTIFICCPRAMGRASIQPIPFQTFAP